MKYFLFFALTVSSTATVFAQSVENHPGSNHRHAAGHSSHAAVSNNASYAGFKNREIKALSSQDQQGLLEGRGMTMALAAELNGYPGPMHVLEHADQLNLSEAQRVQTQSLMREHKQRVSRLGQELVDQERALDRVFSSRSAKREDVQQLTEKIGQLQGQIRAEHLQTHLA